MSPLVYGGVLLFGGLGAVLRFIVDRAVSARLRRPFPYGTLVVNVSGALLLGLVIGLALGQEATLLAGTAVIGSYTTFSTWMFEAQRLGEDRQVLAMAANIVLSLVLGVAAAAAGQLAAGQW